MNGRRAVMAIALMGAACRRTESVAPRARSAESNETVVSVQTVTEDGDGGGVDAGSDGGSTVAEHEEREVRATARAPGLRLYRESPPPVSCDGAGLMVVWREETAVWAARWTATPGTDWENFALSAGAESVGSPISRMGVAWVPWFDLRGSLHVARIEGGEMRTGRALGRYADVWPIDASTSRVLLALRTRSGRPQALKLAMASETGLTMLNVAPFGAGRVVAMDDDSPRRVVVLVREDQRVGGPWFLRAWALSAPRVTAGATVGLQPLGELPIGPGSFEVLPTITRDGAVVFQTVVGAERGVLRLARFAAQSPTLTLLGVAPAALGSVDGDGVLTWWDADYAPHRSRVTEGGLRDDRITGAALSDARAALSATEATRSLECGGLHWTITMEHSASDAGTAREMTAVAR